MTQDESVGWRFQRERYPPFRKHHRFCMIPLFGAPFGGPWVSSNSETLRVRISAHVCALLRRFCGELCMFAETTIITIIIIITVTITIIVNLITIVLLFLLLFQVNWPNQSTQKPRGDCRRPGSRDSLLCRGFPSVSFHYMYKCIYVDITYIYIYIINVQGFPLKPKDVLWSPRIPSEISGCSFKCNNKR